MGVFAPDPRRLAGAGGPWSSTRAALIYQHGSQQREREIADAVDGMIVQALTRGSGR